MHFLLFLEFIGTTELLVVLIVALVVFGPRKLPELGRSLGRALHQLQSASEDFKRTWETETREEAGVQARLSSAGEAAARDGLSAVDAATLAEKRDVEATDDQAVVAPEAAPMHEATLASVHS